ncbi:MAG: AMP-binding protein [Lewinella sp.]|nr:AMP-binding protein [Lewinella sp.]
MNPLSYACGLSPEPLRGLTVGDLLDETVNRFPDKEALVVPYQDIRWTYRQLQWEVDRCARAFLALGVRPGDRVGLWSPNRYEWLVVQLGTAKVGAILVNINPSYRLHELGYALEQSGCAVVVTAEGFKKSDYLAMLRELVPEQPTERFPNLRHLIVLGETPQTGFLHWRAFLALADEVKEAELAAVQAVLDFDDPINIQYTSGTTGYPKGATLSHHNIVNNSYFVTQRLRLTEADRLVIPVPLYHCFGMVLGNLGAISHGATIIYSGDSFKAEEVLRVVEAEKATALYGVPTMFYAELDDPHFADYDLRSLRTGIMAGALCPSDLMQRVNTLMHMEEVEIAYGLTETSPVVTQTAHNAPLTKRVNTVGKAMPHTEIKIIDPVTGAIVPRGDTGELCARGYAVMLGYWRDEKRTRETIDEQGWLHSGDLATMDDEGYCTIVGRSKDMIIRGGENIYPKEIEHFLTTHPAIEQAQVIGVPDEKYGEEVCAWIKLEPGASLTAEEVTEFCKGHIAYYKVPRYLKFVDEYPMTVTGKIRKIDMRKMMEEELAAVVQ